ncbi:acyl-CoA thioesterase [Lentzea alba]|uniref:acyl-CoA thioesterase n=1 Tax=Lentzea alba TaxID=2714351 RepID=UPI0039BF755E
MSLPVTLSRTVEHVDTDASGVVHFSRYASLLETAVLENLEAFGCGVSEIESDGLDLAVAELGMRYVAPARYAERLRIRATVEHVGGAQCRVTGTVHRCVSQDDEEILVAQGHLVLCVVRRADGAPTALPTALRSALRACL